jgi:pyridoxine 5-phosphate synthase
LERFARAAETARVLGVGVNAGHDLALGNLGLFCRAIPNVLEVSIGHALVSHSLEVGLRQVVLDYRSVLESCEQQG